MIRNKKIEHDIYLLLPKLKESLSRESDIIFAYIFGSYGKGKPGPLSDVDVAIYLFSVKDAYEKKLELIGKINSILKTDEVDLVILNEASLSLQFHVLKTGRLLFSHDEHQRLNFITRVYSLYCDTQPLRHLSQKNLIKRFKEGKIGI